MKVLVTADWHVGVTTYGVVDENGVNSRLSDVEDTLTALVDEAEKAEVDLFVMSGDIFHTNKPTVEQQRVFWRHLQRIEQSSIKQARYIIGNHDYNSVLGKDHALALFKDICPPKIKIYDVTCFELHQVGDTRLLVCYYPYMGAAPDWAQMATFGQVSATALVCHSHLEGAVVGAEPFEIKDDSATKFSDLPVSYVWAGHFHKPQLLCDAPLAFYPGSIQAVDFNERNDIKGAVVVDIAGESYTTVGIKTRRLYQIDLEGRTVIPEEDLGRIQDCIVKVNVQLAEESANRFNEQEIRECLEKHGAHSIASINLKVVKQDKKRNEEIVFDNSVTDNFKKYMVGLDLKDDRRDKFEEFGLDIIKQCES